TEQQPHAEHGKQHAGKPEIDEIFRHMTNADGCTGINFITQPSESPAFKDVRVAQRRLVGKEQAWHEDVIQRVAPTLVVLGIPSRFRHSDHRAKIVDIGEPANEAHKRLSPYNIAGSERFVGQPPSSLSEWCD